MPWFLGNSVNYNVHWVSFGIVSIIIWSSFWKGLALWHAAKRNEQWWFIALLVINTAGILEIGYLLLVVQLFTNQNPPKKQKRK